MGEGNHASDLGRGVGCGDPRVLTVGPAGLQLDALNHVHHQPSDPCRPLRTDCNGGKSSPKRFRSTSDPFPSCRPRASGTCPFRDPSPLLKLCIWPPEFAAPHAAPHSPPPPPPSSRGTLSSKGPAPQQGPRRAGQEASPRYAFSRFFFSVSIYSSEAALIFCTQAVLEGETERWGWAEGLRVGLHPGPATRAREQVLLPTMLLMGTLPSARKARGASRDVPRPPGARGRTRVSWALPGRGGPTAAPLPSWEQHTPAHSDSPTGQPLAPQERGHVP